MVTTDLRVEEADGETVLVEEGSRGSDLGEDHLEVVNTLAALLEGHRARVVNENNDVEKSNLDKVDGKLGRKLPLRGELLERAGLDDALRDALNVGRVAVERANVLLDVNSESSRRTHLLDALVEHLADVLRRDGAAANCNAVNISPHLRRRRQEDL